jgi:carbon storage regulator
MVGEDIEIKVVDVNSRVIKLGIEAPKDIAVHRKEVFDAIKDENLAAPRGAGRDKIVSLLEYMKKKGDR